MDQNVTIMRGLNAPLPSPELDLGNIVRLKRPYAPATGRERREYVYGIIVEHLAHNAFGHPRVSLHLYDEQGRMYLMGDSMLPTYVDFAATELILLMIAKQSRVFPDGFDLYPPCPECAGKEDGGACPKCSGWKHVVGMQRVPPKDKKGEALQEG